MSLNFTTANFFLYLPKRSTMVVTVMGIKDGVLSTARVVDGESVAFKFCIGIAVFNLGMDSRLVKDLDVLN